MFTLRPPPLQDISTSEFDELNVRLRVLRLDLIHPTVNGNKWFKLRHNLAQANRLGQRVLVSFGGAFSNHLAALAAAGREFDFKTVGLVRGELVQPLNPVLDFAQRQGMELIAMSRGDYSSATRWEATQALSLGNLGMCGKPDRFYQGCPAHWAQLQTALTERFGDYYLIPEGGGNLLAAEGCATIAEYISAAPGGKPDCVAMACATGTTLAGVAYGLAQQVKSPQLLGIPILKANATIKDQAVTLFSALHLKHSPAPNKLLSGVDSTLTVNQLAAFNSAFWSVCRSIPEWDCGGYAKATPELLHFMQAFHNETELPVEPVYTGKMFYALTQMLKSGELGSCRDIVAVHSGGVSNENLNKLYKTKT